MTESKNKINAAMPHVSHRGLLYIAATVWAFAGCMLIFRGASVVLNSTTYLLMKVLIALIGGAIFYLMMFRKISYKHIFRILNLEGLKQPFYAFFNRRSYILMFSMITMGVSLRVSGIIPIQYLSVFYVMMGIPLLFSSFRFLLNAIVFSEKII